MRFLKTSIRFLGFLMVAGTLLSSCTKTEMLPFEKEENNRIVEYKVATANEDIYGAIDNDKNIITVYIPYFTGLNYINAEVKLDDDAVLLDSVGTQINLDGGLEPVALGDTAKYFVQSSEGVRRLYTVIHKIAAHKDPLVVTYIDPKLVNGVLTKPVHSALKLSGNFESTSTRAKFYFKDKTTGEVHDDFVSINSVVPGTPNYVMTVNILPTALAGDYAVSMEHLGRKTNLPDVKLHYNPGVVGFFLSTTQFTVGEVLILTAQGYQSNDDWNGIFHGVERIYIKLNKDFIWQVPNGFTEDIYNKEFPLEIISKSRTEIKVKFPDLPKGDYGTFYQFGQYFPKISAAGIGFFFDFDGQTNWGENLMLGCVSSTVKIL